MDNTKAVRMPRDGTPRPAGPHRSGQRTLVLLMQLTSASSAKTTVRSHRHRRKIRRKDERSTLSSLLSVHTSRPPLHGANSPPSPSKLSPPGSPLHPFPRQGEGEQRYLLIPPRQNAQPWWAGVLGYKSFSRQERPLCDKRRPRRTRATARSRPKSGVSQSRGLTSPALSHAQRAAVLSLVVMLITRSKAREYFNRSAGNSLDQNKRKALYTEDMRGLQPTCEPLKLFFLSPPAPPLFFS